MNPSPCSPCGTTPQAVNIPGVGGNNGTNGAPAYTTVSAQFAVPAVGATVNVTVADTGWMVVGQAVIAGQGLTVLASPGPATFRVVQIVSGVVVMLRFLGYFGDVAPTTAISAGAILTAGGAFGTQSAATQSSPANPTGTADTTGKMMGCAGGITPSLSGRVLVAVTGVIGSSVGADGASVQIRYGTGAAPANGDALTGTTAGTLKNVVAATGPGKQGFACMAYLTGLTPGTAYWIDLGLKAVTGGTASVYDLNLIAIEF